MDGIIAVFMRWLHIAPAAIAIGGVFFIRIVLPLATRTLPKEHAYEILVRCRRIFRRVIHTCIFLLLLSGIYNTIRNWEIYALNRPLMHGLWGPHVMLGLLVFGISLWLLRGEHPPRGHKTMAAINLGLLLTLVAVAGILKSVREKHLAHPAANGTASAPIAPGVR